jgi:hypothetical protein
MKTWGNLKREIISLGFEKDTTVDKYSQIIMTATNRALAMICATVRPIKKVLQVEQTETTTHNVPLLANDYMGLFLPAKRRGTMESAPSMETTNGSVMIEGAGAFDVYYSARPAKVDVSTRDDYAFELDDDVAELLPLLASYFIWLDDDERKAVMYWNNYEDLKSQILAMESKAKPVTARVLKSGASVFM